MAEVTYKPPAFLPSLKGLIPRPPSEKDYLTALYNPHRKPSFNESAPVEVFLHRELANPHATSKKLARWKSYQFYKKDLLDQFVTAELKSLNGRPEREAKAEAAWKWREKLKEEKEADRKKRWKHKAAVVEMERKSKRKERKEIKMRKRLTELVLAGTERNQVNPSR